MTTFTLDANLEKQIHFIAEAEHTNVSSWITEKLARIIEDYNVKAADYRAIKTDENLYLLGVEASLTEWSEDEDEVNFRDL